MAANDKTTSCTQISRMQLEFINFAILLFYCYRQLSTRCHRKYIFESFCLDTEVPFVSAFIRCKYINVVFTQAVRTISCAGSSLCFSSKPHLCCLVSASSVYCSVSQVCRNVGVFKLHLILAIPYLMSSCYFPLLLLSLRLLFANFC